MRGPDGFPPRLWHSPQAYPSGAMDWGNNELSRVQTVLIRRHQFDFDKPSQLNTVAARGTM
jgi:hypothetical protein